MISRKINLQDFSQLTDEQNRLRRAGLCVICGKVILGAKTGEHNRKVLCVECGFKCNRESIQESKNERVRIETNIIGMIANAAKIADEEKRKQKCMHCPMGSFTTYTDGSGRDTIVCMSSQGTCLKNELRYILRWV